MDFSDYQNEITKYALLQIKKKDFYKLSTAYPEYYFKSTAKINAAEKLRHSTISERALEVIYFTGKSGSGKTTIAKYLSNKFNYDIFISGSGEDFLDGYDKEECLVLDDFRAGSMKFMELLKMLDNNTNSTVRSRYNNKDLSNCKLIVITSILSPNQLYNKIQEGTNKEPIEQLFRRLRHHYFEIQDNGDILERKLEIDDSSFTGKSLGNMADVYKALGIDPTPKTQISILDSLLSDVQLNLTSEQKLASELDISVTDLREGNIF